MSKVASKSVKKGAKVSRGRGRPSPFSQADVDRIVKVVADEGLTHAQEVIRKWGKQFAKISLPTLGKLARAAGLKLSKGRPALEVFTDEKGNTVTRTGRIVDSYGRAVPSINGKVKSSKPKAKPVKVSKPKAPKPAKAPKVETVVPAGDLAEELLTQLTADSPAA